MGLFVLGINHRTCPVEIREKLCFREHDIPSSLRWARENLDLEELVILSTCNRVEIYGFTTLEEFPMETLAQFLEHGRKITRNEYYPHLYRHEGKDMIRHLFRVASGLDSLVVGENEILGQLREAFRLATSSESIHSFLHRAMEKALQIGKSVRTDTKITEGAVSIPSVAVDLAEKIFGKLTHEKVMVLGSGEMSELTLKSLREAGARPSFIVSRSEEPGTKLAETFGGERISFEHWEEQLRDVDILVASTAAPHPIVLREKIEPSLAGRKTRPLFIIDIAVPRNVEPSVDSIPEVYLYNVDDLRVLADSNLKRRLHEVRAAEALVDKAVIEYQGWMEQLKARPVMEQFETFLDSVLEEELKGASELRSLDEHSRQELRRRIRAKLLHPPREKIKDASRNGGVHRYLQALHALFDLDKK